MADPRLKAYAALLATRCLQVRAGDQILIESNVIALPLVEEMARLIARHGGRVIPTLGSSAMKRAVIEELPEEQLDQNPPLIEHLFTNCDAMMGIMAPENTRALSGVDPRRQTTVQKARATLLRRFMTMQARWVACVYPTHALAQDANMSLEEYEDFVYSACLIDWESTTELMQRVKARFDAASAVRIVGSETDIRFSIKGRPGVIDDGRANMPGGEVFYAPLEESVEGHITYEFPAVLNGREVNGIRFTFRGGKIVEASATQGEAFLLQTLDTDEGARFLGEFGIGCNYGIDQFTRNTLFDEKIGGTIHLAIGQSYSICNGTNQSAVHWDMVKEMRKGGQIWLDGVLVQQDGRFIGL